MHLLPQGRHVFGNMSYCHKLAGYQMWIGHKLLKKAKNGLEMAKNCFEMAKNCIKIAKNGQKLLKNGQKSAKNS